MPYDTSWITADTLSPPSTEPGTQELGLQTPSRLYIVIPLRKGSVGCPRKSIRPFRGSTLLEHAVADALDIGYGSIIVTTDYPKDELPHAAQPYHVERPAHLCHNDTPMSLVLKRVAQIMYPMDTILLMQPNCYHPARVKLAKRVLAERAAGTSVRYPDFWHPAYATSGKKPPTRQGLAPVYRHDGLLYRIPVAHLMLNDPYRGTYIPVDGTVNVDTEADFAEAVRRYGHL